MKTSYFGLNHSGEKATMYTFENQNGMILSVTDFGATLHSLLVPTKTGLLDVVLGYDDPAGYEGPSGTFFGATVMPAGYQPMAIMLQVPGGFVTLGLLLITKDGPVAMTLGSFLRNDTFDVHFEKALEDVDGAYAAINQAFARHLHEKYPALQWLNREDDLGIEGLRKAKLSYNPARLVEKHWARLWETEDELY